MAQQQAAQQVAKLLSRVGRWSIVLGVGGSALQASLYTGAGKHDVESMVGIDAS